ncbi:hypothetical protein [Treponema pedis]|uniref:hypothetical protein n=1 Tax=Treponema pedis TaxID=409322 RepID=UPI001FD43DD9|nr:hypothetical protein [Treponema pedis]
MAGYKEAVLFLNIFIIKKFVLQKIYKNSGNMFFLFTLNIAKPLVPTRRFGLYIKATAFLFGLTVEIQTSLFVNI